MNRRMVRLYLINALDQRGSTSSGCTEIAAVAETARTIYRGKKIEFSLDRRLAAFSVHKWTAGRTSACVCNSAHHSTRFNRNALNTTDAELRLIASAAIIGDSNQPANGYSTPAANGTPSAL